MTTIVLTSDEDPSLSVVRFTSDLAWSDAGPEVVEAEVNNLCIEAQECMVAERWVDLVSLMLTSADLVFSKVSEKDLECIFTVICNSVTKSESLDEALEIAKLICSKVTKQPTDKPVFRLKILFNLYNLLRNPYGRFYVYMEALNMSVNGKVTEYVVPSFKNMDKFLKEWNIEILDQRKLFLSISNILKENKSSAKESFNFLTKYLATFSVEDVSTNSETKEQAVRAIVEFVKAPRMFQCDLLDMPAVVQLKLDDDHASIFQLLEIFLTKKLESYLEFQALNSTLLQSYGLVHENCIEKMRLISLVDLASHECRQIPYGLIKDTLQIRDDEVELWVVKAITAKMIDCKMDQMNGVVIVSLCSERVFEQHRWETCRSKLATWRGNIARVISTIQANKITEDGSQGNHGLWTRS